MLNDSLVSSFDDPARPELVIRGSIHDNGDGLVLTCGQCGERYPVKRITQVKVYFHGTHVLVSFDVAHLSKRGEFSLLCDSCASTAQSPVTLVTG